MDQAGCVSGKVTSLEAMLLTHVWHITARGLDDEMV